MKKILLSLIALCVSSFTFAQSLYLNNSEYITLKNSSNQSTRALGINSSNNLYIGSIDALVSKMLFNINGANHMTINSLGNIGIGTTAPDAKLTVLSNGSITQGAELRLQHANNNTNDIVSTVNFANNIGSIAMIQAGTVGSNSNGYISLHTDNGGASSEKLRVTNEGNVGIGTNSPQEKLEVKGNMVIDAGNGGGLFLNTNSGVNIDFRFREAGVNKYNLGYIAANDAMTLYDNTAQAYRWYVASDGKMGIGTASPTEKLSVNGNALIDGELYSKKVKVSVNPGNWPDYVFAPSYELRALSEVENYIKANQHLPEVPSAKEITTNGLDLGAMDATLLKKVEELTLYLIQENKDKEVLKKENQELKDRLDKIEALIKTLTSK